LFYEIDRLEFDLLIGFNLLRKIGAIINIEKERILIFTLEKIDVFNTKILNNDVSN